MRGITKSQLQEILLDLPSRVIISTSANGNFKLSYDDIYIGYIDINNQTLHLLHDDVLKGYVC